MHSKNQSTKNFRSGRDEAIRSDKNDIISVAAIILKASSILSTDVLSVLNFLLILAQVAEEEQTMGANP